MFDAIDYGTKYGYQVFAYLLPNDVSDHSSSEQVYVTTTPSGVKGYYYRIDNNPEESTEDFSDDFTFITNGEIKLDNIAGTSCYIHVYAIDNSGNIGDESVFPIKFATTEFTSVNYLNSRNFRNLGFYLVPFLLEAQL